MKPKSGENYTRMESQEPFGDEMPNFDVCGTVSKELFKEIDVLKTATLSKNSGWKSRENEQKRKRSIVILEDICTGVSQ